MTEPIQDRGYVVGHQFAAGQDHHQKCAAAIDHLNSVDSACNPGVIIDSQMSLDAYVAALCHGSYYQLQQLCPVMQSLSTMSSPHHCIELIGFCNVLLHGVYEGLMCRIHLV